MSQDNNNNNRNKAFSEGKNKQSFNKKVLSFTAVDYSGHEWLAGLSSIIVYCTLPPPPPPCPGCTTYQCRVLPKLQPSSNWGSLKIPWRASFLGVNTHGGVHLEWEAQTRSVLMQTACLSMLIKLPGPNVFAFSELHLRTVYLLSQIIQACGFLRVNMGWHGLWTTVSKSRRRWYEYDIAVANCSMPIYQVIAVAVCRPISMSV